MYKLVAEITDSGVAIKGTGEGKTTLLHLLEAGNGIIEALAKIAEKDASEFAMLMTLVRVAELKGLMDDDDEEEDEDA